MININADEGNAQYKIKPAFRCHPLLLFIDHPTMQMVFFFQTIKTNAVVPPLIWLFPLMATLLKLPPQQMTYMLFFSVSAEEVVLLKGDYCDIEASTYLLPNKRISI